MLASVTRCAELGDQLQLDDEVNSQIADGSDPGTCRPRVTSVGDLPTSSVSAVQLVPEKACSAFCADAPRSLVRGSRRPALFTMRHVLDSCSDPGTFTALFSISWNTERGVHQQVVGHLAVKLALVTAPKPAEVLTARSSHIKSIHVSSDTKYKLTRAAGEPVALGLAPRGHGHDPSLTLFLPQSS